MKHLIYNLEIMSKFGPQIGLTAMSFNHYNYTTQ